MSKTDDLECYSRYYRLFDLSEDMTLNLIPDIRNKLGNLSLSKHIVDMPSLQMGGEENPDNAQKNGCCSRFISGHKDSGLANVN